MEMYQRIRAKLQQIWGYDELRSPQGEIIHSLLRGQDALIILPTGSGKSVCFQLPALLQTGLTLVVSPLLALMENQIQELHHRHLPAALLHSQVPKFQYQKTLEAITRGNLRLLYLSPETLLTPTVWDVLTQPNVQIKGLMIDEAHCIVQWGESFRPAYRRLGAVRPALLKHKPPGSKLAVAAFTATADPKTQEIIAKTLQLQDPMIVLHSPYRANLQLQVQTIWTPKGRRQQTLKFLQPRHNHSGLIYVRSRRYSEELCHWLQGKNYQTMAYHGGLSALQRRQIETSWLQGEMPFVICTSAFGMGVNKRDVRWILHVQPPHLLSEYIQEVGRAGRDGKSAEALTLRSDPTGWFNPEDQRRWQLLMKQLQSQIQKAQKLLKKIPNQGEVSTISQQFPQGEMILSLLHSRGQLEWQDPFHYRRIVPSSGANITPFQTLQKQFHQELKAFLNLQDCRWQFLLNAFGFYQEAEGFKCGHCDRCVGNSSE